MKRRIVEVLALVVLLGCPRAWADPIDSRQILGGVFTTNTQTGQFSIFGPGFSLSGDVSVALSGCLPCRPGDSLEMQALGEVRGMSGTVDGVTYPQLFVPGVIAIPSVFSVQGPFTVPANATTGTQIIFPFNTLDLDRLVGYTSPLSTTPVFDIHVSGTGTAKTTLLEVQNPPEAPILFGTNITWTFGTPSPTPEPASLVLVGTGLAAILAKRRLTDHERRGRRA
ncbi:MAG TPA: PEP-CTERM sorting domain-containing protein [Vicinamibacterales bacterium]|jgi:hypothetical protein